MKIRNNTRILHTHIYYLFKTAKSNKKHFLIYELSKKINTGYKINKYMYMENDVLKEIDII